MKVAAENQDLAKDLAGIRQLAKANGTIGNFFPNKTTIQESELKSETS